MRHGRDTYEYSSRVISHHHKKCISHRPHCRMAAIFRDRIPIAKLSFMISSPWTFISILALALASPLNTIDRRLSRFSHLLSNATQTSAANTFKFNTTSSKSSWWYANIEHSSSALRDLYQTFLMTIFLYTSRSLVATPKPL